MSFFSINGLIGYFDLRNIICDSSKNRDDIIFTYSLPHKIKIYFFNNNNYYLINFSECDIDDLRPNIRYHDLNNYKNSKNSIAINLQRDFINAINAFIYSEQRKLSANVVYSDSVRRTVYVNDINQFFIPNYSEIQIETIDKIINSGCAFSSGAYRIACEKIYKDEPKPLKECLLDAIKKSIISFDSLLKNNYQCYNKEAFYILSNLWKVIYYINHDLRIDAFILLRSIFEVLVKRKYSNKKYYKDDLPRV